MGTAAGPFAAFAGIGEIPTGDYPERTALEAAATAARMAVRDAGLDKSEIDVIMPTGAIFNRDFNSDLIFGRLVEELGLNGTAHANIQVMAGGASGSAMAKTAAALVKSGLAKNVLCVHSDRLKSGIDIATAIEVFSTLGIPDHWEQPFGQHMGSMAAMLTNRYMYETGTTAEQLAAVCVSARKWAELNPNAMFRKPLTVEEVLSSKVLSEPIHAKESNMLADGASAFVVTSVERAADLTDTPVYLTGASGRVTHYSLAQEMDIARMGYADAAAEAFAMAGIGPKDIDIAEIYDAYPVINLIALEEMGLVERGEAGAFVASGGTFPGGALPMTTNGGMLSAGHTGAGGGVSIFVEALRQLMGKAGPRQVPGAKIAVETGSGGTYMDAQVMVLTNEVR
ncbi:MAG: acetyl-CoA acetyltransferase [Hyphomicrobiales bacterium]|nr:MAG: acetyl-CoA acetyltransferase [Hyphomicrobiales bacterium]